MLNNCVSQHVISTSALEQRYVVQSYLQITPRIASFVYEWYYRTLHTAWSCWSVQKITSRPPIKQVMSIKSHARDVATPALVSSKWSGASEGIALTRWLVTSSWSYVFMLTWFQHAGRCRVGNSTSRACSSVYVTCVPRRPCSSLTTSWPEPEALHHRVTCAFMWRRWKKKHFASLMQQHRLLTGQKPRRGAYAKLAQHNHTSCLCTYLFFSITLQIKLWSI